MSDQAIPRLSSGVMKAMVLQTPAHAFAASRYLNPNYREEKKESWDLGSATHKLLLEGMDDSSFAIVDYRDFRSNAAKAARQEAYDNDKLPILAHQHARLMEMAPAASEQIGRLQVGSTLGDPDQGKPEVELDWKMGDVNCHARIDWLPNLRTIDEEHFLDLKGVPGVLTPAAWCRQQLWWNVALQMAFYSIGLWETSERKRHRYPAIILTESKQPYSVATIVPPAEGMEAAERMVMRAVEMYEDCCKSGKWPAHGTKPWSPELKPWDIQDAETMGA